MLKDVGHEFLRNRGAKSLGDFRYGFVSSTDGLQNGNIPQEDSSSSVSGSVFSSGYSRFPGGPDTQAFPADKLISYVFENRRCPD